MVNKVDHFVYTWHGRSLQLVLDQSKFIS